MPGMNADSIIVADTLAVDSVRVDTLAGTEDTPPTTFSALMDSVRWKGGYFAYLNPTHSVRNTSAGVVVEKRSYDMGCDRYVSLLLYVVLITYLFILARNRFYLKEQIVQLLGRRRRSSYSNPSTQKEFRGTLFFHVVATLMWAFFGFSVLYAQSPQLISLIAPLRVAVVVLGITFVMTLLQKILYLFVNWIFFDKKKRTEWSLNRNLLISIEGIILFPAILLLLYSPFESRIIWLGILILLLFSRIYLMIRTFLIFFGKFYDGLHLILYFCTLEAMPLFFWVVALYELQENWKVII
jgi:hypothetical protein